METVLTRKQHHWSSGQRSKTVSLYQNVMAIHPIVVKIFQSGPKCWTDLLATFSVDRKYLPQEYVRLVLCLFACTQYTLWHWNTSWTSVDYSQDTPKGHTCIKAEAVGAQVIVIHGRTVFKAKCSSESLHVGCGMENNSEGMNTCSTAQMPSPYVWELCPFVYIMCNKAISLCEDLFNLCLSYLAQIAFLLFW